MSEGKSQIIWEYMFNDKSQHIDWPFKNPKQMFNLIKDNSSNIFAGKKWFNK